MVATIPDIERIVSDHLRSYPGIGARIVGKTSDETDTAWVRVTELHAQSAHRSDHLIDFLVQCDCFAGKTGGQPEVNTIARTVRKALLEMHSTSQGGAQIAGVIVDTGPRDLSSDVDTPGRDTKSLTATIYAHA